MPQTREHLDILTLLGVQHGIVALTKVDAVPPERTQAATQEVRQFVTGTFLQDAPILPLSNITGQGFEEFYDALKALMAAITPKTAEGVFRVPVERAFSAKGYGTIVAGIPACGSVAIGDEVVLLPQGTKGRVRSVQVYGLDSTQAMAGQCAALNIPQWDPKAIERGNVITIGDYFAPHQWYLCELKLLDQEKADLKNAAQVKFHTGTSETPASVYLFQEGSLKPGRQCLIQVFLDHPVIAGPRDHYIIRSLSPRARSAAASSSRPSRNASSAPIRTFSRRSPSGRRPSRNRGTSSNIASRPRMPSWRTRGRSPCAARCRPKNWRPCWRNWSREAAFCP
jgi:selenocysteine-specific elongation factor